MSDSPTSPPVSDPPAAEPAARKRKRFSFRRLAILLAIMFGLFAGFLGVGGCMMFAMPGQSYHGALADLSDDETLIAANLRAHVQVLAGDIGVRNFKFPGQIERAAIYVEEKLSTQGMQVTQEPYTVSFRGTPTATYNIIAELPGSDPTLASEIILVGAHYDTVFLTPGANDNATGVAVLLELARLFGGGTHPRTLRLVGFSTEEPPWFQSEEMGSLINARACKARGDQIVGMISLETMGCYIDEPGSQRMLNPVVKRFYPDTGNFLAFVGNFASRDFLHRCIGSFRSHTQFPTEGMAAPPGLKGPDFSDHWSYWQVGYPAILLTDTAMLRYEYYHTADDTPDKVDYDRLARITAGVARVINELLGGSNG